VAQGLEVISTMSSADSFGQAANYTLIELEFNVSRLNAGESGGTFPKDPQESNR
jgi:hypothetical protein